MTPDFKTLATNPVQYDSPEIDWTTETENSPFRKFFRSYLEPNLGDLSNKKVLDIGSGTGYLAKLYAKLGAKEMYGVEPSLGNVTLSEKLYPEIKVSHSSFEDFNPGLKFDVAVSVMVFEHIADPAVAFKKIYSLLNEGGLFYLITADIHTATTERYGYGIKVQDIGNAEVAVETNRPQGVMYDIFRPVENYRKYAEDSGFKMTADVPLLPTEQLLQDSPKYLEFKDRPISHLLIFAK